MLTIRLNHIAIDRDQQTCYLFSHFIRYLVGMLNPPLQAIKTRVLSPAIMLGVLNKSMKFNTAKNAERKIMNRRRGIISIAKAMKVKARILSLSPLSESASALVKTITNSHQRF